MDQIYDTDQKSIGFRPIEDSCTIDFEDSNSFPRNDPECDYSQSSNYEASVSLNADIIDMFEHKNNVFQLIRSGQLVSDRGAKDSNVKIDQIEILDSILYGVSGGKLYMCHDIDKFHNVKCLNWIRVKSVHVEEIIHISKTSNNEFLWVQTCSEGFLYTKKGSDLEYKKQSSLNKGCLRNYGCSKKEYVNCYPSKSYIQIKSGKRQEGICYAIYDKNSKLHGISEDDYGYVTRIRIIRCKPISMRRTC
jgi:hypothetical protein